MGPEINDRYVQRDAVIDMEMFQRGVTRLPSVLRRFGFDSMREGQDKVVYALLAGQDLLAVLPTSMGKTFCFQAATLALEWKTLVFSPLIALMRDQVQQAVARGFRVASITSHNTNALNQMAVASWVRGELDFLYVAPERLRSDEFIEAMRLVPPDMIAVDEVHCFPGDYMVATEFGNRTLRDLHLSSAAKHQLPRVWTRSKDGHMELKHIKNTWQHSTSNKRMVRVVVKGKGAADCTDDHIWFCGQKEVKAKDLKPGDMVSCKAFGGQELRGLNPDQLQLVIGSYLGDGGIGCTGKESKSYRLAWTHGLEQKEYCEWKARMLGGDTNPVENNGYSGKPAVRGRSAVFQLPGQVGRGGRWVKKGAIPAWMLQAMDARALAIWFMDDGSYNSGGLILHTQGFTKAGVESARKALERRFGLRAKRAFAKGWILRFSVSEGKKFAKLVKPFLREEFMYKIGCDGQKAAASSWDDRFSTALYPVSRVTKLEHAPTWVYDIEVEDNHNFFVFTKVSGADRTGLSYDTNHAVLVHNCLSAWSDTFRSAFLQIGDFITNHRPRVVSAFTATCPPKVEADIRRVLCLEKARKAIHYPRRQNLDLRSSPFLGFESMFNILSRPIDGSAVVYCVSRKNTEIVAQALQQALPDKRVMFYHGGMKPPERSSVQDDFARGDIDIICATNAFGMGVDKSNVRVVLHRDIASSMEGQSQEDGRAGRDGKYSLCQTLFDSESIRTHEFMIRTSCPLFKEVKAVYEVMQTAKDPTGQVSMSSEDIAKRLRLHSKSMGPILQILAGALVIERSAAITKRWRFRFENLIDDPEFMNFKEIVDTVGEVDGDMLSCRMEEMSDMTGLSDAVLKNRFTKWSSSGLLTCDKPDRSAPIKLIGNIKSVDANRTDNLRKIAQAKLEEVIVYARDVPDAAKHDYVETCMNTKGWEAKA